MDFESRLREVASLAGSEISMDLFNERYQSLLLEVQRLPRAKYEKLERMRRVLHKQFLYLVTCWQRAKQIDARGEPEQITTRTGMN